MRTRKTSNQGVPGAAGVGARARRREDAGRTGPLDPSVVPEDLDEREAPPLHGKTNPPAEMSRAKPSLDDEVQVYHRSPVDVPASELHVDPDAADAAADLAGDLGAAFLSGAAFGEDMSDLALSAEDTEEAELSLLVETPLDETVGPEGPSRPRAPARRSGTEGTARRGPPRPRRRGAPPKP